MQHMWDKLGQDMQLQWTEGNKQTQEVKPNMTQEIFKVKQEVTKGPLTDTESWRLTLNMIIETNQWGGKPQNFWNKVL